MALSNHSIHTIHRLDLTSVKQGRLAYPLMVNPRISLIVPVLNEAALIPTFFLHLLTHQDDIFEVIIVDGGSSDESFALAQQHAPQAQCLLSSGGRHQQLNKALEHVHGDVVVCCPIDVRLQKHALAQVRTAIQRGWNYGCLYQRSASRSIIYRIQDLGARMRARWCANAYIDQVPYWTKQIIDEVGGFRAVQTYDTADLCRRVARKNEFRVLPAVVVSSCRAWRNGFIRQTLSNQKNRIHYLLGLWR